MKYCIDNIYIRCCWLFCMMPKKPIATKPVNFKSSSFDLLQRDPKPAAYDRAPWS